MINPITTRVPKIFPNDIIISPAIPAKAGIYLLLTNFSKNFKICKDWPHPTQLRLIDNRIILSAFCRS